MPDLRRRKRNAQVQDDIFARAEMNRKGINAIDLLFEVYTLARDGYLQGRGLGDKSDTGSAYLAVAGNAASTLARYAYPTMSAIAVTDNTQGGNGKAMDVIEAKKVLESDPFAQAAIRATKIDPSSEALNKVPTFLPLGGKGE